MPKPFHVFSTPDENGYLTLAADMVMNGMNLKKLANWSWKPSFSRTICLLFAPFIEKPTCLV